MTGEQIEFTKLEVGSGLYSDDEATEEALRRRTSLKDRKQLFGISSMDVSGDGKTLIFSSMITNAGLDEGYTIRELGLYARIKDQPETECMVSISLAEIEDDFPAYDGTTSESRILMKYQFTVSNSDTVYLSYEHDPVALVKDVDGRYHELSIQITELKNQRDEFKNELDKEFAELSKNIKSLFPDLPVPTEDDAGKTVKINSEGKAIWSQTEDLRDLIENFKSKHTDFPPDGSVVETDASGNTKRTVFNDDGSITETLTDSDGNVIATKTTTFNADGSIDEEVV
ncbi:MAG: hypothetical protein ACI4EE_10475 [Lachnospiraceae bacterium]